MKSRGVYETPGGTLLYTRTERAGAARARSADARGEGRHRRRATRTSSTRAGGGPPSARRTTHSSTWCRSASAERSRCGCSRATSRSRARESEHALYDERFVTFGEDDVLPAERRGGLHPPLRPAAARAGAQGSRAGGSGGTIRRSAGHDARVRVTPARARDGDPAGVAAIPPAPAAQHRCGAGGSPAASSPVMDAVNRSIGVDFRLWPFDIRLSKAWAMALWNAGVLSLRGEPGARARASIASRRGSRPASSRWQTDEDVHTMIDRLLHEEAGDVASQAAHRAQPERPGGDGHAHVGDGGLSGARRRDRVSCSASCSTGRRAAGRAAAGVHAPAARAAGARRRTGCCRTSGPSIATARRLARRGTRSSRPSRSAPAPLRGAPSRFRACCCRAASASRRSRRTPSTP